MTDFANGELACGSSSRFKFVSPSFSRFLFFLPHLVDFQPPSLVQQFVCTPNAKMSLGFPTPSPSLSPSLSAAPIDEVLHSKYVIKHLFIGTGRHASVHSKLSYLDSPSLSQPCNRSVKNVACNSYLLLSRHWLWPSLFPLSFQACRRVSTSSLLGSPHFCFSHV